MSAIATICGYLFCGLALYQPISLGFLWMVLYLYLGKCGLLWGYHVPIGLVLSWLWKAADLWLANRAREDRQDQENVRPHTLDKHSTAVPPDCNEALNLPYHSTEPPLGTP